MHALAFRVRHGWVGLALSATPLAAVHAQVAIQVKSGTDRVVTPVSGIASECSFTYIVKIAT
jgi:hypothetical protein